MFSSPNVLLLPQRFIPESVRWLLVKGKKEKAREILSNVAKVNKKEMPSEELRVPVTTASKGIFELFKTWNMAKLSLIQCYAWLVMNKASSLNVSSSHHLLPPSTPRCGEECSELEFPLLPPPHFNPRVKNRVLGVEMPTPFPAPPRVRNRVLGDGIPTPLTLPP